MRGEGRAIIGKVETITKKGLTKKGG